CRALNSIPSPVSAWERVGLGTTGGPPPLELRYPLSWTQNAPMESCVLGGHGANPRFGIGLTRARIGRAVARRWRIRVARWANPAARSDRERSLAGICCGAPGEQDQHSAHGYSLRMTTCVRYTGTGCCGCALC